jgi:hypothetical protein
MTWILTCYYISIALFEKILQVSTEEKIKARY